MQTARTFTVVRLRMRRLLLVLGVHVTLPDVQRCPRKGGNGAALLQRLLGVQHVLLVLVLTRLLRGLQEVFPWHSSDTCDSTTNGRLW